MYTQQELENTRKQFLNWISRRVMMVGINWEGIFGGVVEQDGYLAIQTPETDDIDNNEEGDIRESYDLNLSMLFSVINADEIYGEDSKVIKYDNYWMFSPKFLNEFTSSFNKEDLNTPYIQQHQLNNNNAYQNNNNSPVMPYCNNNFQEYSASWEKREIDEKDENETPYKNDEVYARELQQKFDQEENKILEEFKKNKISFSQKNTEDRSHSLNFFGKEADENKNQEELGVLQDQKYQAGLVELTNELIEYSDDKQDKQSTMGVLFSHVESFKKKIGQFTYNEKKEALAIFLDILTSDDAKKSKCIDIPSKMTDRIIAALQDGDLGKKLIKYNVKIDTSNKTIDLTNLKPSNKKLRM